MSKQLFILLGILSMQICASLEVENSNLEKRAAKDEGLKLDDKPYGIAEAINNAKDAISEGQRQKRFFDYIGYSTGSSSFSSVYPSAQSYATSDTPYGTNIPNEQKRLNEILRILRNLAEITRPQYSPPANHYNARPIFIPFNYVPPLGCTCTPSNTNPPPAPQTTIQPPASTYLPPNTKVTDKPDTAIMPDSGVTVDVGSRVGEDSSKKPNDDFSDDYEDGVRPISFDPIPPKVPLSVEVPPVEHGSFQAGLDPPSSQASAAVEVHQQAPGNKLDVAPQAVVPTICEGAILTCCHKPEVTTDCFAKEGCGEIDYGNPCDISVLSRIVSKFRTYFKHRG